MAVGFPYLRGSRPLAPGFWAAIMAASCVYLPVPGLRGGGFCCFPGLAKRSWRLGVLGFLLGGGLDIALLAAWTSLGCDWDPRHGYNLLLVHHLPPEHYVMTHTPSPLSNGLQFGIGLTGWCAVMFLVWSALALPERQRWKAAPAWLAAVVAVASAAALLWITAPLDGWWDRGYEGRWDLPIEVFAVVFLAAIPLCAVTFVVVLE